MESCKTQLRLNVLALSRCAPTPRKNTESELHVLKSQFVHFHTNKTVYFSALHSIYISYAMLQVLTHYYGRDGKYEIGAYNISTPGATLELQSPLPYVNDLVSNWSSPIKNSTQVPDAVATYRKILASQPTRSVAISSIGIHTSKCIRHTCLVRLSTLTLNCLVARGHY